MLPFPSQEAYDKYAQTKKDTRQWDKDIPSDSFPRLTISKTSMPRE